MGALGLGQQTIFRLREQIAQGTKIRASQSTCSPSTSGAVLGAEGGWIFPSKRARGGHLTTVAKQFEKVRKEAGLPNDLVLYCARHGFGTEMYRATKNLFAVMNVMGHTSVSTTMKYQHQNIDEVAEVASHRVQ